MDWLLQRLPGWLAWLEWLMWPIFALAVVLLLFYTFTMIANIIGAPFAGVSGTAYLYERTAPGQTWNQVAVLEPSSAPVDAQFGRAVSIGALAAAFTEDRQERIRAYLDRS